MEEDEIDETESPYCEECGSCGESGCCSPSNCKMVRCKYGEANLKEYRELLEENDKLRATCSAHKKKISDLELWILEKLMKPQDIYG